MHEIQREIIQLVSVGLHFYTFTARFLVSLVSLIHAVFSLLQLNVSLSVLRGYSRSTLSKK